MWSRRQRRQWRRWCESVTLCYAATTTVTVTPAAPGQRHSTILTLRLLHHHNTHAQLHNITGTSMEHHNIPEITSPQHPHTTTSLEHHRNITSPPLHHHNTYMQYNITGTPLEHHHIITTTSPHRYPQHNHNTTKTSPRDNKTTSPP